MAALTAAHQTLPFGSRVRVTNLANSRFVEVVINDRGPFAEDRLIDLSRAAAKRLGIVQDGVAEVRIEVLSAGTNVAGCTRSFERQMPDRQMRVGIAKSRAAWSLPRTASASTSRPATTADTAPPSAPRS